MAGDLSEKLAAKKPKPPKPRCKNCGDETTFPTTAQPGRESAGWCVPCYRNWLKQPTNGSNDSQFPPSGRR